jgi:hypothetical protein
MIRILYSTIHVTVLVTIFVAISCTSHDESIPADWEWFSNDFYNLRLAHPPDWKPQVTTWGDPPDEGRFVVTLGDEVMIEVSRVIASKVTFDSLCTLITPGKRETDGPRWWIVSDCEDTVLGDNRARSAILTDRSGVRSRLFAVELEKQPYVLYLRSENHFDTAIKVIETLSRPPN